MSEETKAFYERAVMKHGQDISPCFNRSWDDCLSYEESLGLVLFYYNAARSFDSRNHAESVSQPARDASGQRMESACA